MRHRDVVAVDRVVRRWAARRQMRHELVAVQVPVDPGVRAAALLQTELSP